MGAIQAIARAGRLVARSALIVLMGVVLLFGVLEVWARLQPRRYFLEYDPTLGFRLEPGATGVYRGRWFLASNPHIRTPVRINALGTRGPERELEKPPGSQRLLVLGDSFVQAFEVPWEQAFYARLEERASAAGGSPLETFPMGVNGYGQAQQLLWLRRDGVHWNPDFVLLVVFLGNDVTDNSRTLGSGAARPYFELRDGELVQVAGPSESARWKYWATDHLRGFLLYRELAVRIDALKALARQLGWVNYPENGSSRDPRLAQHIADAWQLTFALIDALVGESRAAGARFGLAFHGSFTTGGAESATERMLRFCRERGLDCLNLSEALDGDARNFVPDDGHWTAKGHARVADLIWDRWGHVLAGEGGSLVDVAELPQPLEELGVGAAAAGADR